MSQTETTNQTLTSSEEATTTRTKNGSSSPTTNNLAQVAPQAADISSKVKKGKKLS
jgi:hypothetical protein